MSRSADQTLLVILPAGLALGGIASWARYTASAMHPHGWSVVVAAPDIEPGSLGEHARVRRIDPGLGASELGHVCSEIAGELERGGSAVALAPQISGVCYAGAIVAACHARSNTKPSPLRPVVGWMHSEMVHDVELLRRFGPCLEWVIAVSDSCACRLHQTRAVPRECVAVHPTGVPIPQEPSVSPERGPDAPLRLVYTGRIEAHHKRALTLPMVADRLAAFGVSARLDIYGDGPAAAALDRAIAHDPNTTRHQPCDPKGLHAALAQADCLLLPSRSEGLGLSRIEAAVLGCLPVVTSGSGSCHGLKHGVNALIVEHEENDPDELVAARVARALLDTPRDALRAMQEQTQADARQQFDLNAYGRALAETLGTRARFGTDRSAVDSVAADPERAAAFTVPEDAGRHVRALARRLGPIEIGLHGCGAHTDAVWDELHASGLRVVAIADDDPARRGPYRSLTVVAPEELARDGPRDVVLSSWLHQDRLWLRRGLYTDRGVRVHRLYAADRVRIPA